MSSVKNRHDRLRFKRFSFADFRLVQKTADCFLTAVIFPFQISDRLSSPDMLAPQLVLEVLFPPTTLELFVAIETTVVLNISSLPVLLYSRLTAKNALFLYMFLNVSCYDYTGYHRMVISDCSNYH